MSKFLSKFQEKGNIDLQIHGVRCPEIVVPKETFIELGIPEDAGNFELLKALSFRGLEARIAKFKPDYRFEKQEYIDRLNRELETLEKLSFTDYILLVWDVINFCNEKEIPRGLGRGSVGGSLVCYCLDITGVDPIKYGFFFERFVSETRAKKKVVDGVIYIDGALAPDIDGDYCYYRRNEVIEYLAQKYPSRTAKICNISTLSSKALIKDCGKIVADKVEDEMVDISDLVESKFGKPDSIDETNGKNDKFKSWCEANPLVLKIAKKLEGLMRSEGVHASGIVLSHSELAETTPVKLTKQDKNVSCFDMNWVSKQNLKLDVLGLKSASVIAEVAKLTGVPVADVDFEDYGKIYAHLQDLKYPHGLFQIEAETNFHVCQTVRPKSLDQLSAVLALARPGALAFVEQYSKFSNNNVMSSIHPFYDDILNKTAGVCLYQEQLMKMINKIGFSLEEAEIIRRIVGKKKVAEMAPWKKKIEDKVKEQGIDPLAAEVVWKVAEDSANYSFNFSHSCCYATLSAITTYYKFNHPKEFFLSLLRMAKNEQDYLAEIATISREMKAFGMKLLPPHLIKSDMDFKIEGNNIRFGLSAIKGISEATLAKVISFRSGYDNKVECFLAAKQAGLSRSILSALIQAGALDDVDGSISRSKMALEAQIFYDLTDKEKKLVQDICENEKQYNIPVVIKRLTETLDEKGKNFIIKPSRFETIKKKTVKYKEIYAMNSRNEDFASYWYEKALLGYSYSQNLKDIFAVRNKNIKEISDLKGTQIGKEIMFVGYVGDVMQRTSKAGNKYAKFTVLDESASCTVLIFNTDKRDGIELCKEANGGELPAEGDIIVVVGNKKDNSTVFAETIIAQNSKIYMSYAKMKRDMDKEAEVEP